MVGNGFDLIQLDDVVEENIFPRGLIWAWPKVRL